MASALQAKRNVFGFALGVPMLVGLLCRACDRAATGGSGRSLAANRSKSVISSNIDQKTRRGALCEEGLRFGYYRSSVRLLLFSIRSW